MKGPRQFYSDGAELRAGSGSALSCRAGQGLWQRHLEQGMDPAHRSCARAGATCGRQKLVCTTRCGWGGAGRDDPERTIFKHNFYYIQFHLSLKDFGLFIHLLTYSFTIFIKAPTMCQEQEV